MSMSGLAELKGEINKEDSSSGEEWFNKGVKRKVPTVKVTTLKMSGNVSQFTFEDSKHQTVLNSAERSA